MGGLRRAPKLGDEFAADDPANGTTTWVDRLPYNILGAVARAPALTFVASGNQMVAASDANGRILDRLSIPNAVFWGSSSIADGTIYVGDMNENLYALASSVISAAISTGDASGHARAAPCLFRLVKPAQPFLEPKASRFSLGLHPTSRELRLPRRHRMNPRSSGRRGAEA
ncbi:MAG TPA: PQQ-binding-like beta-propeller repeat protein [Chloroflexota bacterium]|nr:PQQ-binding-like beta-propeller repeat protein [Chloroflexota bacterium]